MWSHPVFLIGAGVFAVVTIIATAYTHYRQHQEYGQHDKPRSKPTFDSRILGLCSECEHDVSIINGYKAPCNHCVHYTCANDASKPFRGFSLKWEQICKGCLRERMNINKKEQQDLRLRKNALLECANCRRPFEFEEGNLVQLPCGHRAHEECWKRMQNSSSSTCPMCMDFEEP